MASISTSKDGRRTIQFVGGDSKHRSIRLGKVSMKNAQEVQRPQDASPGGNNYRRCHSLYCPFQDQSFMPASSVDRQQGRR
jgi:hypothetical protein